MSDTSGKGTVTVRVEGIGTYNLPRGENLRAALREEGLHLDGTCADNGTCGRCIVRLLSGEAGQPSEEEEGLLGEGLLSGERLACRIRLSSNIEIALSSERVLELDRTGRWKGAWGSPLWKPEAWPRTGEGYGAAVDMGTTALAAALLDLGSGRPLDVMASANPQIPWGDDILSRLAAAAEGQGAALKESLWAEVGRLLRVLCLRNGVSPGRVTRVVAVGNAAMATLAMGWDPAPLLTAPFSPESASGVVLDAAQADLGTRLASHARVFFPPLMGGFVGSDALVGALAARGHSPASGLLLDVGTNTEVVAWDGDRLAAGSAPAGPAFEGGSISSGMRAEEGAVWKVTLLRDRAVVEVIGGGRPKGICGTGMVDAVAEMVRIGALDRSGRIVPDRHPCVSRRGLTLDADAGLVLTAGDVESLQKAKAAVAAAAAAVLRRLSLPWQRVGTVFLAGAFGSRLDVKNAILVGLLPDLPAARFIKAGDTALIGAAAVLLSHAAQEECVRLAERTSFVSVAEDERFEEEYLQALFFPDGKNNANG